MTDLNKLTTGRIEIVGNEYPTWHGKGFRSPLRANVNKLFQKINWWTCQKHSGRIFLLTTDSFQRQLSQACDCGCWKTGER